MSLSLRSALPGPIDRFRLSAILAVHDFIGAAGLRNGDEIAVGFALLVFRAGFGPGSTVT